MSVLKIKNQNNDWIQIPTIKGDKGDPFTYADFTPEQLESLKGKDGISPTVSVTSDTSDDYRLSFTDETHTVTTPNLIPEAEKIFDVYPHDTASGSIASFPDGADDIPLKSCIVQVEPVQEGSGDPSPDNVRPISGFTWCEVHRTGVNLFDGVIESGDYDVTASAGGAKRNNASRMRCANFIPVKPNTTYYSKSSYSNSVVVFYDEEKLMRSNGGYAVTMNTTFTTPSWCKYITFYFNGTEYNNDISINYPATDTEYHDYKPSATYPITFPSEAGIVYGAYVDVLNGELVVDRAMVVFDGSSDEQWAYYAVTQGNLFRLQNYSTMKPTADIIPAISNAFKAVLQANRTNGTISSGIGGTNIDFVFDGANSLAEWMEWLAENNVQLCYELATPVTYQLTPQEITSLLGQNNIWADTGDTEVEYRASTKMYIDRKITEAVAAALNS